MPDVEGDCGNANGDAVEHDEEDLVGQDWVVAPSTNELCNPVRASNQDTEVCHPQGDAKELEAKRLSQLSGRWIETRPVAVDSQCVVAGEQAKYDKSKDLKDQACNHDVRASIQDLHVIGS
jgi:hypothetical protein